jgi:hypothetical protein
VKPFNWTEQRLDPVPVAQDVNGQVREALEGWRRDLWRRLQSSQQVLSIVILRCFFCMGSGCFGHSSVTHLSPLLYDRETDQIFAIKKIRMGKVTAIAHLIKEDISAFCETHFSTRNPVFFFVLLAFAQNCAREPPFAKKQPCFKHPGVCFLD